MRPAQKAIRTEQAMFCFLFPMASFLASYPGLGYNTLARVERNGFEGRWIVTCGNVPNIVSSRQMRVEQSPALMSPHAPQGKRCRPSAWSM
jgi:hypothetical protein